MKMKNDEMDAAIQLLENLHETGLLGYAIARNKRKLEEEAKDYYDFKYDALEKYGDAEDEGNGYTKYTVPMDKPDRVKAYLDELGDIMNIEHDVDIFTIPADVFYSGSLTSDQMEQLLWMVE